MSKRKFAGLLAILLLVFVLSACGGGDEDTSGDDSASVAEGEFPDLGGREVTIALENAYLPFNYINPETGEGAGWDYDAWDAMCELLNCVPVYVEAAWEGMIQAVSDGQYDAAADGITIKPDRAEVVDFSDGYIGIVQRLLVRVDEDRFDSVEGIQNNSDIVIGTQTGTTNYEVAEELFGADRIEAYEQFPFVVQALVSGDVDVVIIDETAGLGYVGENAQDVKLVGEPLSEGEELGFIFPKGSDLVGPVNLALAELEANGTFDQLAERYFTDQFQITYDDIEFPEYDE